MRTYEQLSTEQQQKAREQALTELLRAILEGLRFNDELNHDDLQARIDKACAEAEAMQTPWFAHEYIMDTCRADLESLATGQAEDSLYSEQGESVMVGIA